MTLIKSISGIRGTIGGSVGHAFTPVDIVKFTAAYGTWILSRSEKKKIVVGRDARISGKMVSSLVTATLESLGFEVVDLGLSTTPTVEMAVVLEEASGGIILTASHNPIQWNALKLLNEKGEFISGDEGKLILEIAEENKFQFASVQDIGFTRKDDSYIDKHIDLILDLPLVDVEAIRKRNFRIAIDCVNSTGGIAIPRLLKALGVETVGQYYCEPDGHFPHNPEPLPENLIQFSSKFSDGKYDLGIVVDPDVDRLAFLCEDGEVFGEEYTLVTVSDYILSHKKGATVSNLSSTRALRDISKKHNCEYFASAVGEVNVVEKMKEVGAVIGGEGNGGIIYPELHYGRDALVGIALFLTHLAKFGKSISYLRSQYPSYFISKNKIELTDNININEVLEKIESKYKGNQISTIDGVKIDFSDEWVHLRKSNTEPIIRIYAESSSESTANHLANKIIADIKEIIA